MSYLKESFKAVQFFTPLQAHLTWTSIDLHERNTACLALTDRRNESLVYTQTPLCSFEYLFIHTSPTPLQKEPDRFGVVLKMVTRARRSAMYNNILSVRFCIVALQLKLNLKRNQLDNSNASTLMVSGAQSLKKVEQASDKSSCVL